MKSLNKMLETVVREYEVKVDRPVKCLGTNFKYDETYYEYDTMYITVYFTLRDLINYTCGSDSKYISNEHCVALMYHLWDMEFFDHLLDKDKEFIEFVQENWDHYKNDVQDVWYNYDNDNDILG